MPIFLPDADLSNSNEEKLRAIWWRICSTTGAGKSILQSWIPKLGPDWSPLPDTHTTPEVELGALPQNFANLSAQIAGLREFMTQIASAQGLVIDQQAIAKAVADELAARLLASTSISGGAPEDTA